MGRVLMLYDVVGTAQAALIRAQSLLEHGNEESALPHIREAARILGEWEATNQEDMALLELHMRGIK